MQAGGHRFDPGQLHQTSFAVSRSVPLISDVDLETGRASSSNSGPAGFYRLRAGLLDKNDKVWMFDNEIDWVIAHHALVYRTGRREATGKTFVVMTRIQGRAHAS